MIKSTTKATTVTSQWASTSCADLGLHVDTHGAQRVAKNVTDVENVAADCSGRSISLSQTYSPMSRFSLSAGKTWPGVPAR